MKAKIFAGILSLLLLLSVFSFISISGQNETRTWTLGDAATSLAISPDGYFSVAGSGDKKTSLFVYDSDSAEQTWDTATPPLRLDGGTINDVSISQRTQNLAYVGIACADKNIYFYKTTSATEITKKTLDAAPLCISSDLKGEGFVVGTDVVSTTNTTAYVYFFTRSGETITQAWKYAVKKDTPSNKINAVAISRDGSTMAAASQNKNVYLFLKAAGNTPQFTPSVNAAVVDVALSNDGKWMAVAYGNFVHGYDTNTKMGWSADTGAAVKDISISGNGKYIAVASGKNVFLYNLESGLPKAWLSAYTAADAVNCIEISNDGNYIIAGDNSGKVYFFHRGSSTPIWTASYGSAVNAVALDDKGNYAVAGGADKKVHLFAPLYDISMSITPQSQNGNPGESKIYKITVTNNGNRYDVISLTHTGTNYNWCSFEKQSVPLAVGESKTINYTVSIPGSYSEAYAGAKAVVDITARSGGAAGIGQTASATKQITTTVNQVFGVELTPETQQQKSVNAGASATYNITVKNTGNGQDTIHLSWAQATQSAGWTASISPNTVAKNGAQADNYGTVTVTVTAPDGAKSGDLARFTITVKAKNGAGGTGWEDTAAVVAIVSPHYGFDFALKTGEQSTKTVSAGSSATYTFVLKNTGNAPDTFTLNTTRGSFDFPEFGLGVGEQKEVTLTTTTTSSESGAITIAIGARSIGGNQQKPTINAVLNIQEQPKPSFIPGFELALLAAALCLAVFRRKR